MNERITLGSLFDGIGGFPLSGTMCGVEPVWASEIEPFPIAVTMSRFPNMKHLGSVTDIKGDQIEPVDIITFGSPCQDLSVAGKQAGIHEGARSNLFFEAVRIIKEMREHDRSTGRTGFDVRPRFAVWENVPGAFSSNKGMDFLAVLYALCDVADPDAYVPYTKRGKWAKAGCIVGDGYSIAWRVYDAQYWGVPQRRKRIYLIADFASERAGEILFEAEGVSGHPETSRETREGTAADAEGCAGGSGGVKCLNPWDVQSKRQYDISGAYRTLDSGNAAGGQAHGICYPSASFMGGQGSKAGGIGYSEKYRVTDYTAVAVYDTTQITSPMNYSNPKPGDPCHPLASQQHPPLSVYSSKTGALCANRHPGSYTGQDAFNDMLPVVPGKPPRKYIVRRLTPLECCRLQGYPDGWTENISFDALSQEQVDQLEPIRKTWAEVNGKNYKPCKDRAALEKWFNGLQTDSAEYKAYGNSLAIPCSYDVIRRVANAIKEAKTE